MCPGQLARDLGTTARELRPTYLRLAEAGRVVLTQQGCPVNPAILRGPYRIAPKTPTATPEK